MCHTWQTSLFRINMSRNWEILTFKTLKKEKNPPEVLPNLCLHMLTCCGVSMETIPSPAHHVDSVTAFDL